MKAIIEQYANLWVAVNMDKMKPKSIIPLVKEAYIAGNKLNISTIVELQNRVEELETKIKNQ